MSLFYYSSRLFTVLITRTPRGLFEKFTKSEWFWWIFDFLFSARFVQWRDIVFIKRFITHLYKRISDNFIVYRRHHGVLEASSSLEVIFCFYADTWWWPVTWSVNQMFMKHHKNCIKLVLKTISIGKTKAISILSYFFNLFSEIC